MRKGFFKENLFALVIALVLSFGFLFMITRIDVLKADIMNGSEKKSIETVSKSSDINLEYGNNSFSVNSNKNIQNLTTLSFIIVYDPTKIKISNENIDSKSDFTAASAGEGKLNVIISLNSMKAGQKLLSVKYTGDQSVVNISDAVVNFTDGTSESLSIGNK